MFFKINYLHLSLFVYYDFEELNKMSELGTDAIWLKCQTICRWWLKSSIYILWTTAISHIVLHLCPAQRIISERYQMSCWDQTLPFRSEASSRQLDSNKLQNCPKWRSISVGPMSLNVSKNFCFFGQPKLTKLFI